MLGRQKKIRVDSLIGPQTELHGDVRFNGGLHIDGRIKGNVTAEDESQSVLTLSKNGSIEGDVRVPHIELDGSVTGDVHARERIELA